MHRLLIALSFTTACVAHVHSGPPPAEPGPPPPPPPVVHDHRSEPPQPTPPPPPPAQPMPPPPQADNGHHAAYLAAVQDLRRARALLQRTPGGPNDVKWDEKVAIREIDEAIRQIHEAKLDVGASMEEPRVDVKMVYRDRLHEALTKLGDAARNLSEKEDNDSALANKREAVSHLNAARKAVSEALDDKKSKGH